MTLGNPDGERTIGWAHFVFPESKVVDALCVISGYGLAELIYFRNRDPSLYWQRFTTFVVIALVITMIVNRLLGLQGQSPRDAWSDKVRRLAFSGVVVLSVLVILYPIGQRLPFERVPIGVVLAGCLLATFLMGLVRMSFRLIAWMLEQGQRGAPSPRHGLS